MLILILLVVFAALFLNMMTRGVKAWAGMFGMLATGIGKVCSVLDRALVRQAEKSAKRRAIMAELAAEVKGGRKLSDAKAEYLAKLRSV